MEVEGPDLREPVKHKNPIRKKMMTVKSGTQVVDRAWKYLKERLTINQNATVGSSLLRAKLRSAQCQYWYRSHDLWVASGTLCEWLMTKFIKKPSQ